MGDLERLNPTLLAGIPVKRSIGENYEFRGKTYSKGHLTEGTVSEVFGYYKKEKEALRIECTEQNKDKNHTSFFEHMYSEGRDEWKGGSYEDLFTHPADMSTYRSESKKFNASDLNKKIVKAMGESRSRRRTRCEYDGEWSYDNRYDVKPFSRSVRKAGAVKIVKLNVEICFSGGVEASTINRYGCFVASIVKALEASGVLVELWAHHTGTGFINGSSDQNSFDRQSFRVKKTDEYMPVSYLVKIFSSNFLRRVFHSHIILAAMDCGRNVSEGLGQPLKFGKVWECIDDTVNIYSVPNFDKQKNIIDELTKFIKEEENVSDS